EELAPLIEELKLRGATSVEEAAELARKWIDQRTAKPAEQILKMIGEVKSQEEATKLQRALEVVQGARELKKDEKDLDEVLNQAGKDALDVPSILYPREWDKRFRPHPDAEERDRPVIPLLPNARGAELHSDLRDALRAMAI